MVLLSALDTQNDFTVKLASYRAKHHGARPYDIATALEVSELDITLSSQEIMTVRGLDTSPQKVFEALPSLGRAMALTRNDAVVSEVKGTYGAPSFHGPMGLVHHDEIDLRLFTSEWEFVVAVEQSKGDEVLRSLQFFDTYGKAVHKFYPQAVDDETWSNFLKKFPERTIKRSEILKRADKKPLESIPGFDVEALRNDWLALEDSHQFHGMLRKHKIERKLAFECIGSDLAREVPADSLVNLIQELRREQLKFMVFVGNSGMIQIRSGLVKETRMLGTWFNILDPDFNLHVNMLKIKESWLVRKPARYGEVLSLESFDASGDLVLSLYGYRTEDLEVDLEWARLVERVLP